MTSEGGNIKVFMQVRPSKRVRAIGTGILLSVSMHSHMCMQPSGFFSPAADNQTLEFSVPDAHVDALGHARGRYDVSYCDHARNREKHCEFLRSNVKFRFDGIFDMGAKQDDVFDQVAKDAVDSALDGYNATIFAYGQTGVALRVTRFRWLAAAPLIVYLTVNCR